MPTTLLLPDLEALMARVFKAEGASDLQATATAKALTLAEADGIPSHGAARCPIYADQVAAGRVDPRAVPTVERPRAAVIRADARSGFAPPALDAGLEAAFEILPETGAVAFSIGNSHHFGVAGHPVERAAERGYVALAFANTPAAVAPWGGRKALYGTNPIAFACPRAGDNPPLVIDSSISVAARGKVVLARKAGRPIPEGWALDRDGNPTTDATAAADGTMVAIGGAKGAALGLMVELLCGALTGSEFGYQGTSFFESDGKQPRVGHFLFLIDPAATAGPTAPGFADRAEEMFAQVLDQEGTRLPGSRRIENRRLAEAQGVEIGDALLETLERRAER
ncbi:MAG: Ldh family oxidoreductase [Alphaproteobacteria bacterium]|nr:Ldh family oxidoreductase [Alphaproteobacteria bacterium]